MPEEKSNKTNLATLIATAAVTVAVGVTSAALGGYLVPARDAGSRAAEVADPIGAPSASPAEAPSEPSVVLVPVEADAAPAAPPSDVALIDYRDDEPRKGTGEREREEEEDDDDHDSD